MRKMRKFVGLLLAMVMVLAMTATAFAADTTISVADTDNRSYDVYQIFTGDLVTKDGNKVLSNVKWGKNGTGYVAGEETAVPQTTLDALVAVNSKSDVEQLDEIKKYVDFSTTAIGTVSKNNPLPVATGYYLLVDKGTVGEGESYSLYVVEVVGPTTVSPKVGKVVSQKKVKDTNDTTGVTTDWQDSADHDITDDVPFQLKGTVAGDYANYKTYSFTFHDKQSAGLTFDPTTVVAYVDSDKDGVKDENEVIDAKHYVVVFPATDGDTFDIVFGNLKNVAAVEAGSDIIVEYEAELNENAVIGEVGNPNEMYLEYSNNPNCTSGGDGVDNDNNGKVDEPGEDNGKPGDGDGKDNDGDGDVDEPGEKEDKEPTGKTPVDKVIVFTYKVVANKYANEVKEGNELPGAGFTLYKKDKDGNYAAIGKEVTGTELTTFEWKGLDDGDYKLEETTTPAGYNTIDPIEFTISAQHQEEADDPKLEGLTDGDIFTGLVENSKLVGLKADVVNNSGTVLPETGGMGTTIFYVLGAILVIGSAVVMITRKRMSR